MRACLPSGRIVVATGFCAVLAACSFGPGPGTAVDIAAEPAERAKAPTQTITVQQVRLPLAEPKAAVASGFQVVEQADPTVAAVPDPKVLERFAHVIHGGGRYWVGKPYEIAGELYEPREEPNYNREGKASWYGAAFHGKLTANGEIFDRAAITAAHPTLPLPSYVRVTNLDNDRSIMVRVNDRGPFKYGRLIDVSEQAASLLGFHKRGLARVRVEYVSKAPLAGNDKDWLLASFTGPTEAAPSTVLASEEARPILARAFAFAPEAEPRPAEMAIRRLSQSMPTAERIKLAFQAAAEAEE